jgi:ankyrin repeat protein
LGKRYVADEQYGSIIWLVSSEDVPIVKAVVAGDADAVKKLLASGANPNAVMEDRIFGTTEYSKNIIHRAASFCDYDMLNVLVDAGADANRQDSDEYTPLMKLVNVRSAPPSAARKCVSALLRGGANLNAGGNAGSTALHQSVACDNVPFTELLLEYGANVNAVDDRGNTPLHNACGLLKVSRMDRSLELLVRPSLLELLVRHGADLSLRNSNGDTCLDILEKNGFAEVAKKLKTISPTASTQKDD